MFENKKRGYRFYQGWGQDGPFGKWFGHGSGPGGFGASRFERGDLKLVILNLLKEKPRHGYDIIQELEKQFHGFYSPSPGSVYPILQLLEDQEYVLSNQQGGKKVYTIIEEGKKILEEHHKEINNMQSRMHPHWGEEHRGNIYELRNEIRQTAQLIFRNVSEGALNNPKIMKKLKEAFKRFRGEIEEIFSEKKDK